MMLFVNVLTTLAVFVWASPADEGGCEAHGSSRACSTVASKGGSEEVGSVRTKSLLERLHAKAEATARAAGEQRLPTAEMNGKGKSALKHLIRTKAKELRERGIVHLPADAGGMASGEVNKLREVVMDFFDKAVQNIQKEMQQDPSLVIRFSDCVARRSHRLDLKPPKLWDPECSFLHEGQTFHEVMKLAFQDETLHLKHCGALVARPMVEGWTNNVNQSWHRDTEDVPELSRKSSPFGVSVYIQLIEMTENNGATQFLPRSQNVFPNDIESSPKKYRSRILSTAGMQAGDVVLFDVRTLHRGMLHTAPSEGVGQLGARPVLQLNFGVEDWVDKAPNWGTRPLVAKPRRGQKRKTSKKEKEDPMEVSLQSYLDNYVDDAHLSLQKLDAKRKKELKRLAGSGIV